MPADLARTTSHRERIFSCTRRSASSRRRSRTVRSCRKCRAASAFSRAMLNLVNAPLLTGEGGGQPLCEQLPQLRHLGGLLVLRHRRRRRRRDEAIDLLHALVAGHGPARRQMRVNISDRCWGLTAL